jgi:hypothetical protein
MTDDRFRGKFFHGSYDGDFPMQRSPDRRTVRRDIAALAWEEYAAQGHGSQTLDRLGERGGFGEFEIMHLLADALLRERHARRPSDAR